MPRDMSLTRYVRCETCGHHYQFQIERCPRCQSNQNAAVPANNRNLLANIGPADPGKPLDRVGESRDDHLSA